MSVEVKSTAPKPFVFVLMPFASGFDDIYKFGIKGAAEDVGAYAERVDEQMYTEGILDRIYNQINKADVIVADMTGQNPNVFYEVGYAHALGKTVLLLTKDANDIPFDLKHRPHTVYGGEIGRLRSELAPKIMWAVGESKKQGMGATETYDVNVADTNIPEASTMTSAPIIRTYRESRNPSVSFLKAYIRNNSIQATPGITHIYLSTTLELPIRIYKSAGSKTRGFEAVEPLHLAQLNSIDELDAHYRLNLSLPPLPPGAVEEFKIYFVITNDQWEGEIPMKLRIHSFSRIHHYPFVLEIEHENINKQGAT